MKKIRKPSVPDSSRNLSLQTRSIDRAPVKVNKGYAKRSDMLIMK